MTTFGSMEIQKFHSALAFVHPTEEHCHATLVLGGKNRVRLNRKKCSHTKHKTEHKLKETNDEYWRKKIEKTFLSCCLVHDMTWHIIRILFE